ncbi:iron uptake transporter permease EfeU [Leekyejoonella antrihumi]|uniref:Ferrous iron transporter n=1 Tax=Leekyejoonella antrihumi TaxID=1660198 RepID=A0A563E1R9_9MICO|nr:iron uptake transporter permease EfeU [Leekyejoonella antrihumi]TWP36488.1 ferrous iron transporter [Leekyejoonella antrihumi]
MLATFVIGLREGLEAALIVGIIAAFLRKNNKPLLPMWIGVAVAVALSIAVGLLLEIVEGSLPQSAQEGMETVIGVVAIVFVTGMVLWMATHARFMKKNLESSAQSALGDGTSKALATMAFLAVLKEGFETAVFLLATFQAAGNMAVAASGATLGILAAIGIGIGLYSGGISINLGRFFKGTSVFLILVAAGLVVSALRTAHEAGWLNAGRQRTADLSWLAPGGSVRSALFTGVLGIPSDPRVIEVIGWCAYLVPMALILFWPATHRPGASASIRIKAVAAGVAVVAAGALAIAVPGAALNTPAKATLVGSDQNRTGTASLEGSTLVLSLPRGTQRVALTHGTADHHAGVAATHYTLPAAGAMADLPEKLTLAELVAANGGRVPVGISVQRSPGPYDVAWTRAGRGQVWTAHGLVIDGSAQDLAVAELTGGGLPTSRTVTMPAGTTIGGTTVTDGAWSVGPAYVAGAASAVIELAADSDEAHLWRRVLPAGLLIAAAVLLLLAGRDRRRLRIASATAPAEPTTQRSNVRVP